MANMKNKCTNANCTESTAKCCYQCATCDKWMCQGCAGFRELKLCTPAQFDEMAKLNAFKPSCVKCEADGPSTANDEFVALKTTVQELAGAVSAMTKEFVGVKQGQQTYASAAAAAAVGRPRVQESIALRVQEDGEMTERRKRSINVVLFGIPDNGVSSAVPDSDLEAIRNAVANVCGQGQKFDPATLLHSHRIGAVQKKNKGGQLMNRPVRIIIDRDYAQNVKSMMIFNGQSIVQQCGGGKFGSFARDDLTQIQVEQLDCTRNEISKLRAAQPEKDLGLRIRCYDGIHKVMCWVRDDGGKGRLKPFVYPQPKPAVSKG
jgi:hypothetical protein